MDGKTIFTCKNSVLDVRFLRKLTSRPAFLHSSQCLHRHCVTSLPITLLSIEEIFHVKTSCPKGKKKHLHWLNHKYMCSFFKARGCDRIRPGGGLVPLPQTVVPNMVGVGSPYNIWPIKIQYLHDVIAWLLIFPCCQPKYTNLMYRVCGKFRLKSWASLEGALESFKEYTESAVVSHL